jgi:hypothetical protein
MAYGEVCERPLSLKAFGQVLALGHLHHEHELPIKLLQSIESGYVGMAE